VSLGSFDILLALKDKDSCRKADHANYSKGRGAAQVITYQPASRYRTFQWLETGIYLTVAILLAWGCFWWVRRRLS